VLPISQEGQFGHPVTAVGAGYATARLKLQMGLTLRICVGVALPASSIAFQYVPSNALLPAGLAGGVWAALALRNRRATFVGLPPVMTGVALSVVNRDLPSSRIHARTA
jgi:hypothetical protein